MEQAASKVTHTHIFNCHAMFSGQHEVVRYCGWHASEVKKMENLSQKGAMQARFLNQAKP
eukprot:1139524-Pelagomonas_calceolata.AAC.22